MTSNAAFISCQPQVVLDSQTELVKFVGLSAAWAFLPCEHHLGADVITHIPESNPLLTAKQMFSLGQITLNKLQNELLSKHLPSNPELN